MKLDSLGQTDLNISKLGLGLAALGRPGYITLGHADDLGHSYQVETMRQRAYTVLDAAWQAGIRYFDAARSYGRAEEFLGSWLRNRALAPNGVVIGSKWGYTYTADWQIEAEKHEVKEHSLSLLKRQFGESQTQLGDYLDLYQIHSATLESGVLENQAVLNTLMALKENNIAIGLSVSGPQQPMVLEKALAITIDGQRLFDVAQATWNLLEPSAGPLLKQANALGVGVIIKEALANGRLTERNTTPTFGSKLSLLQQQAQRLETTIDALALAAVIAQPWVDIVLSGAATGEHLRSNLRASDVLWDDEAAEQLANLAETPTEYWQTRSQLAWN